MHIFVKTSIKEPCHKNPLKLNGKVKISFNRSTNSPIFCAFFIKAPPPLPSIQLK